MSRLKKIAMEKVSMDMNSFQGIINQAGEKGRNILKQLEDYKFTLEQTARLVKNNQALAQGMITKRKSIDEISNKLYQIVFDIENMDISQAFQNQNQPVLQDAPTKDPNQQSQVPGNSGVPGGPMNGQPPMNPEGQPPIPGGAPSGMPGGVPGGTPPAPAGGPAAPANNNTDKGNSNESEESESKPEDNEETEKE